MEKKGLRNSCSNKNPFLGSTNSGLVSEQNFLLLLKMNEIVKPRNWIGK